MAVVEGVGDHGCEYMTGGRVIVLGETGKNFAAGMSGGIAYVLVESQSFHSRCNTEMVELEIVSELQEQKWLRKWIERHQYYTKSHCATSLLENWEKSLSQFVKVMPIEYRAVLEKMKNKS